eukprot:CAMPEP_0195285042 /NCGR_PEP_ID=MMETSP0707-20130614/3022_1 /TAXON_ID=33640 /ORGANISM="Asterionellopsis glacialis, Strain CCMP134" /LENGTH=35 /DNA_ID= /DNA_START= /DNA_END= /DNA_ORIENTATION=
MESDPSVRIPRPTFSYESLNAEFAALSEEEQRKVL